MNLLELPEEILLAILVLLPAKDLHQRLALVCKRLLRLTREPWITNKKRLFLKREEGLPSFSVFLKSQRNSLASLWIEFSKYRPVPSSYHGYWRLHNIIGKITKLRELKLVNVRPNVEVDTFLVHQFPSLTNLAKLELFFCEDTDRLTQRHAGMLAEKCPFLQELSVSECSQGFVSVITSRLSATLTTLHFSECLSTRGEHFDHYLSPKCKGLQQLSVNFDKNYWNNIRQLEKLTSLRIHSNYGFNGFDRFPGILENPSFDLARLELEGNWSPFPNNIETEERFWQCFPNLKHLTLKIEDYSVLGHLQTQLTCIGKSCKVLTNLTLMLKDVDMRPHWRWKENGERLSSVKCLSIVPWINYGKKIPTFSTSVFKSILEKCPNLETLHLFIKDDELLKCIPECHNSLKVLHVTNVNECLKISSILKQKLESMSHNMIWTAL